MPVRILILTLAFLFCSILSFAQNTFQKVFTLSDHFQVFQSISTSDDGILLSGIATETNQPSRSILVKLDCKGEMEWNRAYYASSTINNVSHDILETANGDFILATNPGSYQDYDILLVRLDKNGTLIWQKAMSGNRDDQVAAITEDSEGHIYLVGNTNSYGTDNNGSLSYKDIYIAKLDAAGNALWNKTIGNNSAIDEAMEVIPTTDGGIAVTGRYIARGAFHALLLKIDEEGELQFLKTFGDTLHRNYAFDLTETLDAGFLITGSTTLNKEDHQSYPDAFLLKTNAAGNMEWANSFAGSSSDRGDIGTSIVKTEDNGFAIAVATLSYPTTGFVPNKHVIIKTNATGNMTFARSYTNGGSHYPNLAKAYNNDGYVLSGFTTEFSTTFSPVVYRLDENFNGGCQQADLTIYTFQQSVPFVEVVPEWEVGQGGNWNDYVFNDSITIADTTLCENIVDTCNFIIINNKEIDIEKNVISIFPNPVNDNLVIDIKLNLKNAYIEVLGLDGKLWLNRELVAGEIQLELNVSHFPPGMFVVRLVDGNKNYTKKFIKN